MAAPMSRRCGIPHDLSGVAKALIAPSSFGAGTVPMRCDGPRPGDFPLGSPPKGEKTALTLRNGHPLFQIWKPQVRTEFRRLLHLRASVSDVTQDGPQNQTESKPAIEAAATITGPDRGEP